MLAPALTALWDAGVNLTALWAYPLKSGKANGGKAQLDMIPENGAGFAKAANKAGLAVGKKQTAFFVNGDDRPGAVADTLSKLSQAGINVGAVQAVCGGTGRYGAVLFLPQADVRKASKALGVS